MALRKTEKADLKTRYPLFIEVGMILTLALLIVAFRLDLRADSDFNVNLAEQEVVQMEEIQQTQQIERPPPPPRPPVPVEVPNDEILDDDELELDVSLDLDAAVDLPPPPPPPADEPEPEPEIFVIVEQMPDLIGGLGELQSKIRYPEIAKKAGVEGRVIVQFVVNEQGMVENPVVVRGIGAGCDEEAIRAVQQARFTPGKQRGKPVKVKMSLPITFKLK
ncbi:MAG: energy transducer TonB [Rhodothermales bacterium]|nr:energy transducer TonB [Rhodothermales bacterium]MBO6778432.1 energy transducer TonB [Rhodothermales bacterium]